MSSRRYADPLDVIWLAAARAVGLQVERTDEVYAASDGRGTLRIGAAETLDADDCLAQMILHELCHSLVQGCASFQQPDWGLDNIGEADLPREHAALRVQAALLDRHGLRALLAPTTEHRAFYQTLGGDPLANGSADDASLAPARAAIARADEPPWAPHLADALERTRHIAELCAGPARALDGALLWAALVDG